MHALRMWWARTIARVEAGQLKISAADVNTIDAANGIKTPLNIRASRAAAMKNSRLAGNRAKKAALKARVRELEGAEIGDQLGLDAANRVMNKVGR